MVTHDVAHCCLLIQGGSNYATSCAGAGVGNGRSNCARWFLYILHPPGENPVGPPKCITRIGLVSWVPTKIKHVTTKTYWKWRTKRANAWLHELLKLPLQEGNQIFDAPINYWPETLSWCTWKSKIDWLPGPLDVLGVLILDIANLVLFWDLHSQYLTFRQGSWLEAFIKGVCHVFKMEKKGKRKERNKKKK